MTTSLRQSTARRAGVHTISADVLAARSANERDLVLIDVREPDEHRAWAIPGSTNIPLDELAHRLAELPREEDVFVYCAKGGRSARASSLLADAGFTVFDLVGGIAAWGRSYDLALLQLGDVEILQFRRRGKGCLSYLIACGEEALAVDPGSAIDQYLDQASLRGWQIRGVIDTHLHADHLSGARALSATAHAPHYLSTADNYAFTHEIAFDGRVIPLGDGTKIEVWATPGHTGGSIALALGTSALFSGDTLFIDGIGRPDLANAIEADATALFASLELLSSRCGAETWVLPAHQSPRISPAPKAVAGAPLKEVLPTLAKLPTRPEGFVTWAREHVTERPANYEQIVELNRNGITEFDEAMLLLESGPSRCAL